MGGTSTGMLMFVRTDAVKDKHIDDESGAQVDILNSSLKVLLVRHVYYMYYYVLLCFVMSMWGERWSHSRALDCQSRGRWFNPNDRCFKT